MDKEQALEDLLRPLSSLSSLIAQPTAILPLNWYLTLSHSTNCGYISNSVSSFVLCFYITLTSLLFRPGRRVKQSERLFSMFFPISNSRTRLFSMFFLYQIVIHDFFRCFFYIKQSYTTFFNVFLGSNSRNDFFPTFSDGCNSRCKR